MAPLLIPAVASLADTVLQTFNRTPNAQAATQSQQVDFQALLEKTASTLASRLAAQPAQPLTADAVKQRIGNLQEVQSALAGSLPGQQTTFAISADGQLSRVLPNGAKETLVLSSQSQALVQQLAASINPGGGFAVTLTAQRALALGTV